AIIKEIIARIDGLNDLIQDLLVFARPPQPKLRFNDLGAIVTATADLLKKDAAFGALQITFAGQARLVAADATLLTIVFQNLLINAAQATNGRGSIAVLLSDLGETQRVVITDNGPGIPTEIQA